MLLCWYKRKFKIYFTSSCLGILFSISYSTREVEHTKFLLDSHTIISYKYSSFPYSCITHYLHSLSNTNCGRLYFPKMATMANSIPYALLIMWCWNSSLQVVRSMSTPFSKPGWSFIATSTSRREHTNTTRLPKLSQICHATSLCSPGTQPPCCEEAKRRGHM